MQPPPTPDGGQSNDSSMSDGGLDEDLVEELRQRQPGNDGAHRVGRRCRLPNIPDEVQGDIQQLLGTLLMFKSGYNWSQSCMNQLLGAIKDLSLIPDAISRHIPSGFHECLSAVEAMGITPLTTYYYDACSNCSTLYRFPNGNADACPTCHLDRYATEVEHVFCYICSTFDPLLFDLLLICFSQQSWQHTTLLLLLR